MPFSLQPWWVASTLSRVVPGGTPARPTRALKSRWYTNILPKLGSSFSSALGKSMPVTVTPAGSVTVNLILSRYR